MTDNIIAAPWRDGTPEGEKSADLFDEVIMRLLCDAPTSTQIVRGNGAAWYVDSIIDGYQMQKLHLDYLLAALDDIEVLDLVDQLAAHVRVVCEPLRATA